MSDGAAGSRSALRGRIYDRLNAGAEAALFADHRRWLADQLRGEVLDLGVGTGAMFPYYAGLPDTVDLNGVDRDPAMLARAEAKAAEHRVAIELVSGRAESLPFADDAFDVVLCSLVLCSVETPDVVLAEVERVLRPSGRLVFFEHVRTGGVRGTLEGAFAPVWAPFVGGCRIDRATGERIRARFDVTELDVFDIGDVRTFPVKRFVRGRAALQQERGPPRAGAD